MSNQSISPGKCHVFYRVPACEAHGPYLSETVVYATSKEDAKAQFLKSHPDYPVTSVIGPIHTS